MLTRLTAANFEEQVVQSSVPVLVDFSAEWCAPCKFALPILEELNSESQGEFKVGKIDVEQEQELANRFAVSALPTMLVFSGGRVVHSFRGVQKKAVLREALCTVGKAEQAVSPS